MKTVPDKDELMLSTEKGMIVRCPVKDIRATGRSTQGVRLMRIEANDRVSSIAKIVPEEEEVEEIQEKLVAAPTVSNAPEEKKELPKEKEEIQKGKPRVKAKPKEKTAPKKVAKSKTIKRKK